MSLKTFATFFVARTISSGFFESMQRRFDQTIEYLKYKIHKLFFIFININQSIDTILVVPYLSVNI